MNFLTWFYNLISDVTDTVSTWENPVIYGIKWLEGLFGKGIQDLNNTTQIVSIVDQNLATISTSIIQEAGTIEAMILALKNINPSDVEGSLVTIQADAEKIYQIWTVQNNAILTAISEISKQITIIENTGL